MYIIELLIVRFFCKTDSINGNVSDIESNYEVVTTNDGTYKSSHLELSQ